MCSFPCFELRLEWLLDMNISIWANYHSGAQYPRIAMVAQWTTVQDKPEYNWCLQG